LLALALVALALEADRGLRLAGLAAAGCFALAAVIRGLRVRHELSGVRRAVDRLILRDPRGGEVSDLVQWRARELLDPAERHRLARGLERTVARLDPTRLPSASPLRRGALRRHEDLLRAIAARLDGEEPVTARGVLLVQGLVDGAESPFYRVGSDDALARTLIRVLGALEP